jgi:hypothetical protein
MHKFTVWIQYTLRFNKLIMSCLNDNPNCAPDNYDVCRENCNFSSIKLLKAIGCDCDHISFLEKKKFTSFTAGYIETSALDLFLYIGEFTRKYKTTNNTPTSFYSLGVCSHCLPTKCSLNGVFWQDFVTLKRRVLLFVSYLKSVDSSL